MRSFWSSHSGDSMPAPSRRISKGLNAEREELRIAGFNDQPKDPGIAEQRTAAEVASWYGGSKPPAATVQAFDEVSSNPSGYSGYMGGVVGAAPVASVASNQSVNSTTQPILSLFDTLCPELVVPRDSECTLLVPRLETRSKKGQLLVDDPGGEHVFRAVLIDSPAPTRVSKRGEEVQYLMLGHAEERGVFGRLSLREQVSKARRADDPLTLFDREDNIYGKLEYVGDDAGGRYYVLTAAVSGKKVYLNTDHHHRTFEAKNDQGKLLAIVDEDEHGRDSRDARILDRRKLVIGPTMDGGLLALCLLGIDWLREMDHRTQWRTHL